MKCCRIALSVVFLISAVLVWGQTPTGRIAGRVTDATGAIVSNATVTIQNTGTGLKRVLESNSAGDYVAPNLAPGVYAVTVSAPTFKSAERRSVRLEVASEIRLDFELSPGQVSEVVEVMGQQTEINTITDTLGGTLTNKAINELPLQGRDFQNLLELRPGIQRTPGGGFHSVTSNGNRTQDNNYIVDGTDGNDVYWGESVLNMAGVLGTPASHLPLDAIQEFNTQENQSADYGWKPGAVVNIGLKSGTNQFHGTAYYFHRNSAFDARNYFNPAPQPLSDLLLHNFGASFGGPIIKDKWFIFGNYEGVRHKVGNPYNVESPVTVPIGDPELSLPDAEVAAGCPAACSLVSRQLAKLFLPNLGTTTPGDPASINFNFNNTNREDNMIVKSDYHLNSRNTITGRYFYANSLLTEEDTAPIRAEWLSVATTHAHVMGVNWTWIPNPHWVNEARFGYNRNWQSDDVVDHNKSAESYGLNTGITDPRLLGFPRIDIGGFNYMGGNYSWPLFTTPNYTYQATDNVSVTHGAHNLGFGAEFRYGGADNFRARYGRGRVVFDSLVDFLQGNIDYGQVLTGDTHRNITMKAFGAFIQDNWRIRPRVTLTLGLRYDLSLPIHDEHNQIANFLPDQGLLQVGHGIDSPYATDWNNFSPRAGIAWDVFGTGKTVLRAGGAIIYEQPAISEFVTRGGLNDNPSGAAGVTPGTGNIQVFSRFPDGSDLSPLWLAGSPLFDTSPGGACTSDEPCDVFGVLPHLATPYVASWNFNLQQQLTKSTVLEVGYVANRGIKLFSHRDINQVIPALDDGTEQFGRPFTQNCPAPVGIGRGGPCFPWIEYANLIENMGNSNYQGLQATLTQRASHGLDFLAGYTWAHAIDNGTSNLGGYPQDNNNYNAERGNGDFDIRHRFTFSVTYEPPKFKAPLQFGEGWTVTSIVNLQTGEPYNLYDSYDDISATAEFTDRWNFFGNPDDIKWGTTQQMSYIYPASTNPKCAAHASASQLDNWGCLVAGNSVITPPEPGQFGNMGRNIFRGPAFANWDMSLTKRWKLNERMNLQLRGEFFNILNHTNFDLFTMSTDISDPVYSINDLMVAKATPDVGVANPVVGSGGSRHIQLGVKLIW